VTTQLRGVRFSIQSAFIFPQMRRFRYISDILQYIYITMRARSLSHLCADHGRFFRTVPALFLSYLTARSCTDLAFLVATGPTPGLCRGVETGPGVALVWDKWSRTSAETPLQNRFWTLGGPMEALGHPTVTRVHRCWGWVPDWSPPGPTGGTGPEPTRAHRCWAGYRIGAHPGRPVRLGTVCAGLWGPGCLIARVRCTSDGSLLCVA